jgi:hypothetical protein
MVQGDIIMGTGISICLEGAIVVIDEHTKGERRLSTKAEFLDPVITNLRLQAQVGAWQGGMSLFKPLAHDDINSSMLIISAGNPQHDKKRARRPFLLDHSQRVLERIAVLANLHGDPFQFSTFINGEMSAFTTV